MTGRSWERSIGLIVVTTVVTLGTSCSAEVSRPELSAEITSRALAKLDWHETAILRASAPRNYEQMGLGADLSLDGTRALLGSSGRAHVFVRAGAGWSEEASFLGSGAGTNEYGRIASLSDDATRAMVGFPYEGTGGVVRTYTRSGSSWSDEAELLPPAGAPGQFGFAVALSGDGSHAIVGMPGGAVVYGWDGSGWAVEWQQVSSYSRFGSAVAMSADGSRVLVGDPGEDIALVFARNGTIWTHEAPLVDPTSNDPLGGTTGFGYSVALNADASVAAVGASFRYGAPDARSEVGSVRVFVRSGATWSEQALLEGSGTLIGDRFGYAVALSADGSRALIGVPGDDEPFPTVWAGSARVFARDGTTWTETETLIASDPAEYERLGTSVALSGDGTVALAGAMWDDITSAGREGSGRVFTGVCPGCSVDAGSDGGATEDAGTGDGSAGSAGSGAGGTSGFDAGAGGSAGAEAGGFAGSDAAAGGAATAGYAGASAAGGAAAGGGASAAGGAAAGGGAGATDASGAEQDATSSDAGSCGCALPGRRSGRGWAWAALALVFVLPLRGRKQPRS